MCFLAETSTVSHQPHTTQPHNTSPQPTDSTPQNTAQTTRQHTAHTLGPHTVNTTHSHTTTSHFKATTAPVVDTCVDHLGEGLTCQQLPSICTDPYAQVVCRRTCKFCGEWPFRRELQKFESTKNLTELLGFHSRVTEEGVKISMAPYFRGIKHFAFEFQGPEGRSLFFQRHS